jgi:5-(carboxyamino)imidazole ribonucleotide synthase
MLIQDASKWDVITYVLDPEETCPAGSIASHFTQGDYRDFDTVYRFGDQVDVLTYEIENINVEALRALKADGVQVVPDPEILALIQDKGRQKDFVRDHGFPTAPFRLFDTTEAIREALARGDLALPFVQKLRRGGYDGRGVAVFRDSTDLEGLLEGPSLVEDRVDIHKEIAVIVARNGRDEVQCFPPVEMVFDPEANLVDRLICPSTLPAQVTALAEGLARDLIQALEMQGLLAVEFFVDTQGRVLINEMSPRPHNSGHHTIEGVITSQFEQHLRAILNLPLGCTRIKLPAVMLNLLGEPGHEGPVRYEGLTESMAIEGVKVHLYGKKATRPMRKMGHVTVLSEEMEDALVKADRVKELIKVKS